MSDRELIQRIKDAFGTAETGDALVEVARNAHRAEQQLAAQERQRVDEEAEDIAAIRAVQPKKYQFLVERTVSHREWVRIDVEDTDVDQAYARATELALESDNWSVYEDSEETELNDTIIQGEE